MILLKSILANSVAPLMVFIAVISATSADAGSGYGLPTSYLAFNSGIVLFNAANRSDIPTCATSFPNRWAINGSTVAGQSLVSAVLTAMSQNKSIAIAGTGDCSVGFSSEAVLYVIINN